MPVWYYTIYGLVLSARQPLPGLIAAPATESADIQVHLLDDERHGQPGASERWSFSSSRPEVDASGTAIWKEMRPDGGYFRILFNWDEAPGYTEFAIAPTGDHIWGRWEDTLTEDVISLLLGAVIACALRIRGLLCLHASVVRVGVQAIAILGEKGMGKSTTAAALAQRGHPIQADDIAALEAHDQGWFAQSGEPRLRLWPSSLEALATTDMTSMPILSVGEKRALQLDCANDGDPWQFHTSALPLARIYVLEPRRPELTQTAIAPLVPTEALMALLSHVSAKKLPLDPALRASELERLSRLVMQVPVLRIQRPDDLAALPGLCDAIVSDTLDAACA